METFIVIPCLNEQESLSATCTSLGFGQGADPIGRLVLVDNGSTDGTLAVMSRIQAESPPKRVLIIQEPRRGYVSARRAGISAVLERARVEHLSADETLVFQADADTVYLQGYVEAMVAASSGKPGKPHLRPPASTHLALVPPTTTAAPATEQVGQHGQDERVPLHHHGRHLRKVQG